MNVYGAVLILPFGLDDVTSALLEIAGDSQTQGYSLKISKRKLFDTSQTDLIALKVE